MLPLGRVDGADPRRAGRSMGLAFPEAIIIAYSGMDDDASRMSALKAGAEYFLSKNSDPEVFDRCIQEVLAHWSMSKAS